MAETTVDRIRAVLKDLRKVTRVYRLYGGDHPETERIIAMFVQALVPLLHDRGNLELEVDPEQLRVGDTVVFEDDDTSDFAEVLYREGIERLTLLPGIERQEMMELVRLLSLNLNLPGYEEETLTSMLWQADLPHIRYEAVEGLVEAVEQSEAAAAGELGQFSDVLASILSTQAGTQADPAELVAGMDNADFADMAGETMEGTYANIPSVDDADDGPDDDEPPPYYQPDLTRDATPFKQALLEAAAIAGVHKPVEWSKERRSAAMETIEWAEEFRASLEVPAEQIAEYWKTLGADTFGSMLGSAMDATLFLAARPVDGMTVDEAIALSNRGMEAALTNRETGVYLRAMKVLDSITSAEQFDDPGGQLTELSRQWSSTETLTQVLNTVDTLGEEPDELALFIERGGMDRTLAVRDLLGRIEDPVRAEVATDALLKALRHDPTFLTEGLKQLEPDQLIPLYSCMARSRHPEMQRQVRMSLHHPAPEIRMHGLRLVVQQHDENTWRWLAPLAKDKDPDVRRTALEMLDGAPVPQLEKELRPEMAPATFASKPADEMTLLARCYGRAGKQTAVPALRELIFHKRWRLLSSAARPDVLAALSGLLAANTDESRLIVLRASKSWMPGLKAAGLSVMQKGEGRRG
jgi:hypothetical protein